MCDLNYLKSVGATHVLNTAEQHVSVSQARYAAHGIQYYGFHVDDLPHCNISRSVSIDEVNILHSEIFSSPDISTGPLSSSTEP